MSRKSASSRAINPSVVQQTHSTGNSFKLNQLTCSILAVSAWLLSAPAMAAPITDQASADGAGMGDTITVNAGVQELNGTTDYTLNKKVTGTGGLTKNGTNTVTLNIPGSNYSSTTTINAGTLKAGTAGVLSSTSHINIGAMGTLDISSGNQNIRGLQGDEGGTVNLGTSTLTTSFGGATTLNFNGTIVGNGGLIKQNTTGGTLILGRTNTYSGITNIMGGTLQASRNDVFSANSDVNLTDASSVLNLAGFDQTIKGLESTVANSKVMLGTGTLTTKFDTAEKTFAGIISGDGGLTKAGSGTLILTNVNTYTGTTTVNGGTLELSKITKGDVEIAEGGNLSFNFADNQTQTKNITGTGTLTKAGDGNLTLSGTNSGFTGNVTIRNGKLSFAAPAAPMAKSVNLAGASATLELKEGDDIALNNLSSTAGTLNLGANLTATYTGDTPSTIAGNISGTKNFTKAGSGTLIFSGTNPVANGFTGNTLVKEGTLQLTTDLNSTIAIGNGATLQFNNPDVLPYSKAITDADAMHPGHFIKTGAGKVTLSGANTFSGDTIIEEGTLAFNKAGSLKDSKSITLTSTAGDAPASGNLELTGADEVTLKNLSGMAGSKINLGTTNLTAVYDGAAPLTIAGNIAGSGNFTKDGEGTLTFSGTNDTFTGNTTVNAGTLQLTTNLSSAITIKNGATLEFSNAEGESLTYSKVISNSPAAMVPAEGAGAGAAQGMVKKTGKGTVILDADNSYTGETIIEGGTLQFNTLPLSTKLTIDNSKGDDSILAIHNTGNVNFDASKIAGTDGAFKKTGAGELTLNGAASQFSGTTLVDGGTLKFVIADAIKASVLNISATGTVDLANSNQTFAGLEGAAGGELKTTATGNLTLDTAADTSFTFNGKITGAGTVTKTGTGTQIFNSADNNTTGAVTVNTGTLLIGADTAHNTAKFTSTGITVEGGTLGGYGIIAAPVTIRSGGFLSPGSTSTATPGVSTGSLTIKGGLTIEDGATLNYVVTQADGDKVVVDGTATIKGGTLKLLPSARQLPADKTYTVLTATTLTKEKDLTVDDKQLESWKVSENGILYDDNQITFTLTDKPAADPGKKDDEDEGNQPTLVVQNHDSTSAIFNTGCANGQNCTVNLSGLPAGTPVSGGNVAETRRLLSGNLNLPAASLSTANLQQTDVLVLNGGNNQVQSASVSGGTLMVGDAQHGTARLTVADKLIVTRGGTLAGHGTIAGNVEINGGGLEPGGSIGTTTIDGSLLLNDGVYNFDIASAGADHLVVTGNLTVNGGEVTITVPDGDLSGSWKREAVRLITASGKLNGQFRFAPNSDYLALLNIASQQGSDALTITVSPKFTEFGAKRMEFRRLGRATADSHPDRQAVAYALSTLPDESLTLKGLANTTMDNTLTVAAFDSLTPDIYASADAALLQNSHYVRDAVLGRKNALTDNSVWITGWGHGGRLSLGESAVSSSGWGVVAGVDTPLLNNLSGGLLAGYEHSDINSKHRSGNRARFNLVHAGAYLDASLAPVNLRGGLIYSYLQGDVSRQMSIPDWSLNGKADTGNSSRGHQFQLFAEISHDFRPADNAVITPYGSLAYVWQHMNGTAERSNSPATFIIDSRQRGVAISNLGLRAQMDLKTALPASVYASAGWQHTYNNRNNAVTVRFSEAQPDNKFSISGVGIARDVAQIGAGVNLHLSEKNTLTVSYQGEFGGGYTDNAGKLQWQLQF